MECFGGHQRRVMSSVQSARSRVAVQYARNEVGEGARGRHCAQTSHCATAASTPDPLIISLVFRNLLLLASFV